MNAWLLRVACVLSVWSSEPPGQQYALRNGDAVLYWKADEIAPTYGVCYYAWGYVPTIVGPGGSVRFCDVEWAYGQP